MQIKNSDSQLDSAEDLPLLCYGHQWLSGKSA